MKKFNQKNINRIVFQRLFENEAVTPPVPELGVLQGDAEPTESAYDWVFKHLPKNTREAIQDWVRMYEGQRKEWWERFQEMWREKNGDGGAPSRMKKEFNELWEKMKQEYVRLRNTDPRGMGLPGNVDGKMSDIFYKHFGYDLFDGEFDDDDDAGQNDFGPVFELG